jgi:hypothetical protein
MERAIRTHYISGHTEKDSDELHCGLEPKSITELPVVPPLLTIAVRGLANLANNSGLRNPEI